MSDELPSYLATDLTSEDAIRARAAAARALTETFLDRVSADAPTDWGLVGPALLLRAEGALAAIIARLAELRHTETAMLVRSLYEHVVHFAWIAVAPEERLTRWQTADDRRQLKLDEDVARITGVRLFEPDEREVIAESAARADSIPDVASMAEQADRYWNDRARGLWPPGGVFSFRGLYVWVYRHGSNTLHPSLNGAHACVARAGEQGWFLVREPAGGRELAGLAPSIVGLGLLVSSVALGRPNTEDVLRAFGRLGEVLGG